MESSQLEKMRAYIKRMHEGQKRQDGTTAELHVTRVATLVTTALKNSGEANQDALEMFEMAALGHDLIEDTKATKEEIKAISGDDALSIIETLTNTLGDDHPLPFVTQVCAGSEEARIVKLGDLCDNFFHASYSIYTLGVPWMHSFFLPIVEPMHDAIQKTSFIKYPEAAATLLSATALARTHLKKTIEMNS